MQDSGRKCHSSAVDHGTGRGEGADTERGRETGGDRAAGSDRVMLMIGQLIEIIVAAPRASVCSGTSGRSRCHNSSGRSGTA